MMFKLRNAQAIAEELGKRLRTQRLAKNLTQEQLAARADVSVGAIRRLEKDGQTTVLTLLRIVKNLGLEQELEPLFELQTRHIDDVFNNADIRARQRASGGER